MKILLNNMNFFKQRLEYLKDNPNGYWFKRKLYGWGWVPVKWQGWTVLLVWVVLYTFALINMDHEWFKNLIFIIFSVALLIYICYKKGEKPKWQWGIEKKD